MSRRKKLVLKFALILAIVPVAIRAYEYGPDPGYAGAPGDNPTSCVSGGCHVGALNAGGGTFKIVTASSYAPGMKQHISVQISDPAQSVWGFQLTARLKSNLKDGQAGDFTTGPDKFTQVLCADGNPKKNGSPCPSAFPIQYIEHTQPGTRVGTKNGVTFEFDWTPPTNAGNVILYAAGNASFAPPGPGGSHIYTTSLELTPAASQTGPVITDVENGTTFQPNGIAPNMYVTIKGQNLAANTRLWAGSDFNGNQLPNSLDGTSVTVNGAQAYVEYISPTQINIITPASSAAGNGIPVVVTANGQSSAPFSITMQSVAPSFFAYQPGTADDLKYAIAEHADGSFTGKQGLYPSAPGITTPAKPGEIITLFGTGFGPTNPALAPGIVTDRIYNLDPLPVITIGGMPATVTFGGLVPPYAQFYQINLKVPAGVPDGDQPLVATVGGASSSSMRITVHQ